jgi:hypothetical protein
MAEEIPSYVETVMREFREVRLEWLRRSRFPLPGPLSPIVISVVKNEADRLEDFLRYYRNHGIERFVFVDNGSTDGGLEFLLAQPDVDVCERLGKFDWMLKQGWINKVVETYGYERWYIYVDADEQIVFDGCETRTFTDLTVQMERQGLSRVRGFLVDMYSEAPLMQTEYAPGQPLIEAFAWFDHDTYKEERYKEIMSVKGGPRQRAFGGKQNEKFRPELTKYPLFKIQPGQYMANPHHIWPYKGNFESARYLGVLHFKFLPGLLDRIRQAIEQKNYWDGSYEYQCYLKVLEGEPRLSLHCDNSNQFESSDQLVSLGLLASIDWADDLKPWDLARVAYNRRRQEHLARHWPQPSAPQQAADV